MRILSILPILLRVRPSNSDRELICVFRDVRRGNNDFDKNIGYIMYAVCGFDSYGDAIKWTHFPRCWPFVGEIHRSPVDSRQKGQWRGALMFSLIGARINSRDAGDLRRDRVHYDVSVMVQIQTVLGKRILDAGSVGFLQNM